MKLITCSVCMDEWNEDAGPRGGTPYANCTCSKECARTAYTALFLFQLEITLKFELAELRGSVSYIQHGS